jgi:hypothetical protein
VGRQADQGLREPKTYSGALVAGTNELRVTARIHLDATGEVVFAFDPVPFDNSSRWLLEAFYRHAVRPPTFRLTAVAEGGTNFETNDLHLERCTPHSDKAGNRLELAATCLSGTFRRPLAEAASLPLLRLCMRGYESFGSHEAACALGRVVISAHEANVDTDDLSGSIAIQPAGPVEHLPGWTKEAERLLEHVRRVMSLAAGVLLRAPIRELYRDGTVHVEAWSQTAQGPRGLRVIHFMRQEEIFRTAVQSFFAAPVHAENLFAAIEWLTMPTTYNEMRLVCAMTALETIIDSNVIESEEYIEPQRAFEKIRGVLRQVIAKCIAKWTPERADDVKELNEKLLDLNRRSLFRKVSLLAKRWQVPLDRISEATLRNAIKARNLVIHRGQYYASKKADDPDLWEHVCVIREVVVRILFTALGYRGRYISYIGYACERVFPPSSNDTAENA